MSRDQTPLNAPELVEKLRRILAKPLSEDEDERTATPRRTPLRSGSASPGRNSGDPMGDAIRKKLSIRPTRLR